ncbi:MAG: tetratricopeptide repeat protein [Anaerolineae bacterium]|nr:tetratricopeptide repeat protein [Anaerolineae bacterium]
MKRIALITLFLAALIFVPGVWADGGEMAAANVLAANGRTAEAIRAYENLVSQGMDDANLYFNLGNAYYQNGELGQAILNYRRAEQLAPRDGDIQHNLALARAQAPDQFNQTPDTIVTIFLADMADWLTLNETAVLTLLLWTVLWLALLVVRRLGHGRSRTLLKYSLLPLALLFLLSAFALGSRLQTANNIKEAVIVAQVADVYAGPGEQYGSDFQLHGGAEVALYQTRGDWAQIGAPGTAMRGWVHGGAVTAVSR